MKNTMKSLKLWVLGCVMLFAGAQSASAALSGCEGTVYFKLPDGWKTAYAVGGGQKAKFTESTYTGWLQISTASIGAPNAPTTFFIEETGANDCNSGHCATKSAINVKYTQFTETGVNANGFTCKDFGSKTNELWIQPSFEDANKPLVQGEPPDVKYFYVFLPDDKVWKSSVPMISENGKDKEMDIDADNCGWYYRRYVNEALPTEVYIHRDDDETLQYAIGMQGEGAETLEKIDLDGLFNGVFNSEPGYSGALFFVADQKKAAELPSIMSGWYVERPAINGSCSYNLAARIYDSDAKLHPAFSCYSGPGDGPANDGCQKVDQTNAAAGANPTVALKAIYDCIGVTPGIVESTLDRATKKPKLTAAGKRCFIDEKYFNMLFNYTPGVNEVTCFDMPFTRADDGKWEFDSDFYTSPGLETPVQGGFYPVEATDEKKLKDADSTQQAAPLARTKRTAEGPVFYGPNLRELHPTEKIPMIDVICNGPGWKGGHKCDGLFADGDGTEAFYTGLSPANTGACVFGWSCPDKAPANWAFFVDGTETSAASGSPRWKSEEGGKGNAGRNQHFCFESHAEFRFKKGLKFSFRGDDDIWVYIDNKLAVDLGGTHLAAPGYVDLDTFMPEGKPDSTYDIDIFFCDRRTTMSNVRIKTNMFIEQTVGIKAEGHQNSNEDYRLTGGNNKFKLKYSQSGGGSCAAARGTAVVLEGKQITDAGYKITYTLTTDKSGSDPTKTIISAEEFEANPVQLDGIIDVTEPGEPMINEIKLKKRLTPDTYYLRITIGTDVYIMSWEIKGSVAVANRDAVIVDATGYKSPVMPFKGSAMATNAADVTVDQLIPLYIAPITDPCGGTPSATCTQPIQLSAAVGSEYSLDVKDAAGNASTLVTFYKLENGQLSMVDPVKYNRKIGAGGVDTLYATIPFNQFTTSQNETVVISVKDSPYKATLSFFVPTIAFVESETSLTVKTSEPDNVTHLKSEEVDFYLIALDPTKNNSPCGDACNFKVTAGSELSKGLEILYGPDSTVHVVNGRATVTVKSSMVYELPTSSATLHVKGPSATMMQAKVVNLQFIEPPVPTPLLADIFDVHGELPASSMNIPAEYFSMQTEYLDGIGDSLAIYYYRPFINHEDSLPNKIAVFWDEDEKDSVVFEKAEIKAGTVCGAAASLPDSLCLPRITLGGKKLSKNVKTSGKGKLKSWATYTARGTVVTNFYSCAIYDRIAPIIVSARAMTETMGGVDLAKLKIEFSEPVQKTTEGDAKGDAVLSFYINNGKQPQFTEYIPLNPGSSIPPSTNSNTMNLLYSANGLFPQSGDYIHFGSIAGVGLFTDQSDYATYPGGDTLRPADDATYGWNIAPGYNASGRLPSPWVLISGDVSAYAVRIIPSAMGGIPRTPAEAANLDAFDIFTYDANKDDDNFRADILAGQGEFEKYGFIPHGWYVKTDMGAMIESKEDFVNSNKKNVFFDYELSFFTNLGSHVATKKGRIFCDDDKNFEVNQKYYFGGAGHNCVETRRNFYIVWNMKSDKNRLVGSGAFITKLKTYVQLDNHGKKNKFDKTEMWGVRHNAKTIGSFPVYKANP
ncbi:fibro-slime domain-containing protein [Fibrobacter sp. UWB12]|nr:fibro-slime domain-containing protein [Fibrobacter sp. UWB12]